MLTVAGAAIGLTVAAISPLPAPANRAAVSDQTSPHATARVAERRYDFPLKPSNNRRYLVDQRNVPFMIVGDSPQALIGNLSVAEAAFYIADRKAAGFNALWVDLLCTTYTGCRVDGKTFDGVAPFTTPGDLSTPNSVYFARADAIIRLAAKAGMVVFLDPIETGGWLGALRSNGLTKDQAYGRFLGRRYRSFSNIVWAQGNDFQGWRTQSDDALVLAVASGIRSADPQHMQTIELDYPDSGSLDDARWRSVIQLDAAYTYYPTYARVLREYERTRHIPVYLAEAGYEFEQNNSSISKGDPPILRRQEYWSILSGAAGQFYGNHYTWQFADGWKDHLDTAGSAQLGYLASLFAGLSWFRLVPDRAHKIVTGGYGRFSTTGDVGSSDYVTTAATPDGTLAVSYLPAGGTVTVNMARFSRPARARWFDPTNGTFKGSRTLLPNRGEIRLTAPVKNAAGDGDWVLVLTA